MLMAVTADDEGLIPIDAWDPLFIATLDGDRDGMVDWLNEYVDTQRTTFQALITLAGTVSTLIAADESAPANAFWGLKIVEAEDREATERAGQLVTASLNEDLDMVNALAQELVERGDPDPAMQVVTILLALMKVVADHLEAQ